MKRYNRLSLLAVLFGVFCLAGCEPEDPGFEDLNGMRTITIGVTHEGSATKADIGEDLKFSWTPGDQIAVYAGDRYYTSAGYVSKDEYTVSLSGIRTNYAVYPATIANPEFTGASADKPLKVDIPAEYDFRSASDTWSPMPMVAVNVEDEDLDFMHLGGLLRIAIGSLHEDASYVIVKLDKPINGTFPVHIVSDGSYISNATPDEIENGTNQAKFLVPSSGSVVLNLPVPVGTYESVTVSVYDAGNNLLESETHDDDFSWDCERAHGKKLTSLAWVYVFGDLTDVSLPYTGGEASLASAFKSYRTKDGVTLEAVDFILQYSNDGGVTWTTTVPTWLTSAPEGGIHTGGNTGESMNVSIPAQMNSAADEHHDNLVQAGTQGSQTNPFDLSTVNVATGTTCATTTANCYVVQAPGYYKFPLVFGNALVNGEPNDAAYHQQKPVSNDIRFPDYLYDYTGMYIKQPYIALQSSVAGKTLTAKVLWTDAINLVTDASVAGTDENAYISFKVPEDRICQGNAIVALLANDIIVWSWHIWVTDQDLIATQTVTSDYYTATFAPVNLGWCEGKTEVYAERSCLVRAVQDGSHKTETVTVKQVDETITTLGNNPYYQWGRKDPMQAANGNGNTEKIYYPVTAAPAIGTGPVGIYTAIRNPNVIYVGNTRWCSNNYVNLWNTNSTIISLTVGDIGGYATLDDLDEVVKTIYDPCPVGYNVGSVKAWFAFEYSTSSDSPILETQWIEASGTNPPGRVYPANGLFFPAYGSRSYEDGHIGRFGTSGVYWAAQSRGTTGHVASFNNTYFMVSPLSVYSGSYSAGYAIRPIKENPPIEVVGENLGGWDD